MKDKSFIPQIQPSITNLERDMVASAIESSWITENKETKKFEEYFANISNRTAISYANGTCALLAIGYILQCKLGKIRVAVPDLTFIASMSPFLMLNAEITLVDIEKESCSFDTRQLDDLIGKINCLVIPVIYGATCDLDLIELFCKKHNIILIVDGSQSVGQKSLTGRSIFSYGQYAFASFYGNKIITSAEGAVIFSNEEDSIEIYRMKNHGRDEKGIFYHDNFGLNFAFSDIHAAFINAQITRLDDILFKKKQIYDFYEENITNKKISIFNKDQKDLSNHWFTSVFVDDSNEFVQYLKENMIGSRRSFGRLSDQKMLLLHDYPNRIKMSFPLEGSKLFYDTFVSLPSSFDLSKNDMEYIVEIINKY